jgi:hypothetical protein
MTLRFTTKDENIKPFVCLSHGQMSIKCIFVLNCLLWSLIIQRVQNAEIGISHHSMDSQASKKEHLMKSGIVGRKIMNVISSRHNSASLTCERIAAS